MTNEELTRRLKEIAHLIRVIWYNISKEQQDNCNINFTSDMRYIDDKAEEDVTIKFTIKH